MYLLFMLFFKRNKFLYEFVYAVFFSNIFITQVLDQYSGVAFPIRFLQMLMLCVYIFTYKIKINIIIYLIIFYCIFLISYYLDIYSISYITNFITFYLIFLCGKDLINDSSFEPKIIKLASKILLTSIFYLAFTLTFGIGYAMYDENNTVGGLAMDRINIVAYCFVILIIYLIRNQISKKNIIYLFIGIISILIVSKRLPILMIVVGFLITLAQSKINFKKILLLLRVLVVFSIFILILPEKYGLGRLEMRGKKVQVQNGVIKQESRYLEYLFVFNYIEESKIENLLIGNNFKSTHKYRKKFLGLEGREIHTGYINNLYRFGLIGFTLTMTFLIWVAVSIYRIPKNVNIRNLGFPLLFMLLLYEGVDIVHEGFPSIIVFLIFGRLVAEIKKPKTFKLT
jgi:hypothetical protein